MLDFRSQIAAQLRTGPKHSGRFKMLKTTVDRMVRDGHAKRVRHPQNPEKGAVNWIEITTAGLDHYFPTKRTPK